MSEDKKHISVEICIDSMESADAAVAGGADRLEVCSALQLGGLTPSVGIVSLLHYKYPALPLHCMIRQRAGDFVYTEEEMCAMVEDVEWLKKAGATGFVFGALTASGAVDRNACQSIVETARPLPVTFHRAIDVAFDWKLCLEDAIELGFKAVLTSGQEPCALDGVHVIREMQEEFSDKIDVLVGCGVNSSNVPNLVEWTRCQWYHASAAVMKHKTVGQMSSRYSSLAFPNKKVKQVKMGRMNEDPTRVTSAEEVRMLKETLAYGVEEAK